MPVNFFQNICRTESNLKKFGLCDDPPPARNKAYIAENDESKWIAEVKNSSEIEIIFYGIDHCVNILRPNGEQEKRCDGVLHYNNNLIFVELKDSANKKWIGKGRKQLTATIRVCQNEPNPNKYLITGAYIANKQEYIAKGSRAAHIEKFNTDTGLILYVITKKENINIPLNSLT